MKSRALIPACRCLIFLLWTTSLTAHWLHVVFLPIWWADLLDWRCFWPPSEFTACWLIWSAKDRARSVSAWPWARRSEERRVGKGWRCWREGDDERTKSIR